MQVPQGSLYPALHRLENRGLLTADWKMSDTGRESKFYRLTAKGRRQLKEEAASWLRLTEAIGLILKTAGGRDDLAGAACSGAARSSASSTPSFATTSSARSRTASAPDNQKPTCAARSG